MIFFQRHAEKLCLFLSAGLLILAHPPYDLWPLAWMAFVPFLDCLDGKGLKQAFRSGYLLGLLFYSATLFWFIHMAQTAGIPLFLAFLAAGLLVMYLAVYHGLFAVLYVVFSRLAPTARVLVYAAVWTALEFLRDRLFSGFGWLGLGHSQYKALAVIQIADVTGVFGISFVVMAVNVFLAECLLAQRRPGRPGLKGAAGLTVVLVGAVLGYGIIRLQQPDTAAEFRVNIVQPNIAQERKWHPSQWPAIMGTLKELTQDAARKSPADLTIWPETSFPGYIWEDVAMYEDLKLFVQQEKISLLFGAVTKEGEEYYNSAILLSPDGREIQRHDKLHLVPFGEFIPLRRQFPFLSELIPVGDFTSGRRPMMFPAVFPSPAVGPAVGGAGGTGHYAVLICFEDTLAPVARRLVNAGAGLLVNMTNDAWFINERAPKMHLQAAVFRTVENRRGLLRAANTGVSCYVDPKGRIHDPVNAEGRTTFAAGTASYAVSFQKQETFYTKFGDVFTYLCFGCILWGIIKIKFI